MTMQKVLVAGATGYLGRFVVKEFKKQGFQIRVLARNRAKLESLSEFIDEEFIGEITGPNSLQGICKDIDIVFSSIGITKQRDGLTYMDVDYQGNMNLLEQAKKAGVSKFIYISVFNAEKMRHLKGVYAKLRFEEAIKKSRLDYTIIYPNGFFSDMRQYLQMAKKGKGYVFGSGDNKINPIHGEDLAEICIKAASAKEREINIGGPDVLNHNEILTLAFNALNKKVKISRIPLWIRDLLLVTFRTFTPVRIYGPIEFFMTVLSTDLIAPIYGKHHLKDFFFKLKNNERQNNGKI
jgi:uncharacterized protein YbjT (DUF2867 family)